MAVRADENALRGLCAGRFERPGDAAAGDGEPLGRGVDVVELQRGEAARVPALGAASSCLLHERPLDLPPAVAHRGGAALEAPPGAVAAPDERGLAVVG